MNKHFRSFLFVAGLAFVLNSIVLAGDEPCEVVQKSGDGGLLKCDCKNGKCKDGTQTFIFGCRSDEYANCGDCGKSCVEQEETMIVATKIVKKCGGADCDLSNCKETSKETTNSEIPTCACGDPVD